MKGRTHFISSGLLTYVISDKIFKDRTILPAFIGAWGAILPDIDIPYSMLSNKIMHRLKKVPIFKTYIKHFGHLEKGRRYLFLFFFFVISFITYILTKNIYFAGIMIYLGLLSVSKHRTISHSLLSMFILWLLFYLGVKGYKNKEFFSYFYMYLLIGYGLHLLEDLLTYSGVPLLYPLNIKFRIPIFKVNSTKGNIIEFIFIFICLVIFGMTFMR